MAATTAASSSRSCGCFSMPTSKLWVAVSVIAPFAILWITDLSWLLPRNLRISSTTNLWKNASLAQDFLRADLLLHPVCEGKERLLGILHQAGKHDLSIADCDMLPTWQEVADLYGDQPSIHGLDTCQAYRDKLQGREPDPRVAGLFNTGTNAFAESLQLNFKDKDLLDYNVPSGKHTSLLNKKWTDRATNSSSHALEFPITLIRDPFRWMISMCKARYKAEWVQGVDGHCPNLVPNTDEQHLKRYQDIVTFEVTLDRDYSEHYDSLADMWSEWYRLYVDTEIPGLIIRFEDTLFHADQVMKTVLECIGRPMNDGTEFRYHLDASKEHGNPADFVTALAKYGSADGRDAGLAPEDRLYVQTALDQELMHLFHYKQVPTEEPKAIASTLSASEGYERPVMSETETHDSVANLVLHHAACEGKEHLLAILHRAGKDDISVDDCQMLPTWDEVTALYGDEPIIVGLDTCEKYRSRLAANNLEPDPRVAGLFNVGTNAFAESLMLNYKMRDILEYTAPGGKHTSLKNKIMDTDRTVGVLPIALIRDPYRWMNSMCKSPYKAQWMRGEGNHCPNLVPDDNEITLDKYRGITTFEVTVDRDYDETYDSIADMWSEYYDLYMRAEFPRLLIRFEDTLYHAERVMELVSECIGVPMKAPFKYHLDASKEHGNPADFATALAKYGRLEGREGGMTDLDKEYAAVALNGELMQTFRYPQLPPTKHSYTPILVSDVNAAIDNLVANHPECHGKEKLLRVLVQAGMADLLDEDLLCNELPTWNEVSALYGDEPVIYGLESCQRYRDKIAAANSAGMRIRPDPRVGGLFNTGTNALAESLMINFKNQDKLYYNAPGGKHTPLSKRYWESRAMTTNSTFEFPIILVRDPYRWMNSMCKAQYKVDWLHGTSGHCPNLVPSAQERLFGQKYQTIETYEVAVDRDYDEHYKSLADMWSEWYREWVTTSIPSLIIRFEDNLFHADKVMETVMECIGQPLQKPFLYQLDAAKAHGQSADFLTALAKYGRAEGREGGMLLEDKQYARAALDPMLLNLFRYKHVPLAGIDVEEAV